MFGSENDETVELPAGVYSYNFEYILPESIPYSIEGERGCVRYRVEAILEVPWTSNFFTEKPFTVKRFDDLNLTRFPKYRLPCEVEEIKTFCGLSCKSKPLVMTMRVNKTGFGLGESIPIHIELFNKSKINVCSTEFSLIKIESFNSPLKSKSFSSVVTTKTARGVRSGEAIDFIEFLDIPSFLPTSNARFCRIFEIKYEIKFKANTGGFNDNEMSIGIEIGHVGIVDANPPPVAATEDFPTNSTDLPLTSLAIVDSREKSLKI